MSTIPMNYAIDKQTGLPFFPITHLNAVRDDYGNPLPQLLNGLHPIDISTLSVESTFSVNDAIGIDGIIYRAKVATEDFPFTPVVDEDGNFCIEVINGETAIAISDDTLSEDWEVYLDLRDRFHMENRFNDAKRYTDEEIAEVMTKINALTRHTRLTDFDLNTLKKAVAEQNLEKYGLKVGDQKTINGHTYVIAELNPFRGARGNYRVQVNHVGLIVLPHVTQVWNASGNTYTGADSRGAGYLNSDLHYYLKNTLLPLVNIDLGESNLIGHSKLLSNAVNQNGYNRFGDVTGCASGWTWESDCKICALSEVQVYGAAICSSSLFDTGEACRQLEVFQKYSHTEIFRTLDGTGYENIWLRDVVTAFYAARANVGGAADYTAATGANLAAALVLFH